MAAAPVLLLRHVMRVPASAMGHSYPTVSQSTLRALMARAA